jgi:hypothetical protein
VRVDKCFYEKARIEVNANFPATFPDSDKIEVAYQVTTPKPRPRPSMPSAVIKTRSPPKAARAPAPKALKPPATITKPPSPRKTKSPVETTAPRSSSPVIIDSDVTEGPNLDQILTQMTKSHPKPMSPIKDKAIPQVTVSNMTPAQAIRKRTVTFTAPAAKKAKTTSSLPITELLNEVKELRKAYRCIDNLHQVLADAKENADNSLNRLEEIIQHLGRENEVKGVNV